MKDIKIVVGACFGDEGKGLTTDYFCSLHPSETTLGVLNNGGAQRSHTVISDGVRHAFRHHSSGTFAGAASYISDYFITNLIAFREEHENLPSVVYANEESRVTLPGDMILNQAKEVNRGANKDGSCGFGIFETYLRNRWYGQTTLGNLKNMTQDEFVQMNIKTAEEWYIPNMIQNKKYGIDYSTDTHFSIEEVDEVRKLFFEESIFRAYWDDLQYFYDNVILVTKEDELNLYNEFDHIVIENGQGLRLSENYIAPDNRDITASDTGSWRVIDNLLQHFSPKDIEVIYVMRRYLTRHGVGEMRGDLSGHEAVGEGPDLTNEPNQWQTTIRYAIHSIPDLIKYINNDSYNADKLSYSLMITHCDKTYSIYSFMAYPIMRLADKLREETKIKQLYTSFGEDNFINNNIERF